MKFEKFRSIREKMISEGLIEDARTPFKEYRDLFMEMANRADAEESNINEAASDIFKNIYGFMKLKGLESKYVKSMVDQGAEEMNFSRKKADSESKKETDQLKIAHSTKVEALKDNTAAIADRIDSIATTDFLKKLATKIKTTARIKKNEILIKLASDEEAKELRGRNQELQQELSKVDQEIGEYQEKNKEKIEDATKQMAEEAKAKVQEFETKISEVQDKINAKEEELSKVGESVVFEEGEEGQNVQEEPKSDKDQEKGKIYAEIAKLKAEKAKLKNAQLKQKEIVNTTLGKDEYDLEKAAEEINTLVEEAKDYEKKANEIGVEVESEPKPDQEAIEKQKKVISNLEGEISKIENDIKDAEAEKTKKNKEASEILKAALSGKKNALEKAKQKLKELSPEE